MDINSVGINPELKDESATSAIVPSGKYAITVRHAHMEYKSVMETITSRKSQTTHVVLKDFNMTVQKGHIYALLGASGCGKTTLLRAIVGQHDLASGEIRVLGHKPKTPDSGIPGTTIGYMPQDTSLPEGFLITETFHYYGQLAGMSTEEIDEKVEKLCTLLEIPKTRNLIGTLSGGQQRRVSFAVALLHSPPVLILDEPTVGVDSLLRESIWQYMNTLTKNNGTTVIITTHYIEEATLADSVGLMRRGKLMAEEPPLSLMQNLMCNTLEEVLLKLCVIQSTNQSVSSVSDALDDALVGLSVNEDDLSFETASWTSKKVSPIKRIRAVAQKTALFLLRNYLYTIIFMIMPTVFSFVFCTIMGTSPKGINVSVFNQETDCFSKGIITKFNKEITNDFCEAPQSLSCDILKYLERKDYFLVSSDSEESAEEDVRRGRSWAAITFDKNFTSALIQRASFSFFSDSIDDDILNTGSVHVAMDQSDRVISFDVHEKIFSAVKHVMADFDDACHSLGPMKDLPIRLQAVYGDTSTLFRDFTFPGALTDMAFLFPLMATLCALFPEKIEGTFQRSLVAGVKMQEIVAAHFLVYFAAIVVQIMLILIVPNEVLQIYKIINYQTGAVIMLCLAIEGMIFGFLVAALCNTATGAMYSAAGLCLTIFNTSGMAWPLEGVPGPIRPILYMFPLTIPTEALRDVAHKGWSLSYKSPQLAIVTIAVWSLIFLVALIVVLRYQNR